MPLQTPFELAPVLVAPFLAPAFGGGVNPSATADGCDRFVAKAESCAATNAATLAEFLVACRREAKASVSCAAAVDAAATCLQPLDCGVLASSPQFCGDEVESFAAECPQTDATAGNDATHRK